MPALAIEASAAAVFERLGGTRIDPSIVLPASLPLELSGEAVRNRLCLHVDHRGGEYVLRPDLTLPVAAKEAAARQSGRGGEIIYRYAARAFRLPSPGHTRTEFTQVGFERFGGPATAKADAEALAIVTEALAATGVKPARAQMGDLAIFPAFIDALGLPETIAGTLKRAFRQSGGAQALLAHTPETAVPELVAQMTGQDTSEAEASFLNYLETQDIPLIGTRTPREIIQGLHARASAAEAGGVPQEARAIADAVLGVDTALDKAAPALEAIAIQADLKGTEAAIERVAERAEMIANHAPNIMTKARFGTPFGRRFTYYDGFVFELFAKDAPGSEPFGGGGRYDGLIAALSNGEACASGIGGVVRPDRIAAALEADA